MITGLYKAASALGAAEINHEAVSRNLSYMDTPGYRRTVVSFEEQLNADTVGQAAWRRGTQAPTTVKDFTPGQIEVTGRTLDVAIEGDGFFVVATPQGRAFTRGGVFFVGQEQQLVTAAGYEVQGARGPISIPAGISPREIKIGTDGTLFARNSQIGQIQVVQFEDNAKLKPIGIALFSAEGVDRVDAESVVLRQGARERSNVSATAELNRMILGLRYQEAAQRALRQMSDIIEQHTRAQGS